MDNDIVKRLVWSGMLTASTRAGEPARRPGRRDRLAAPLRRGPARVDARCPKTEKSVAELVFDVSERTSSLIREEIELAKAEVTEKVTKLLARLGRRRSPPASSPSSP